MSTESTTPSAYPSKSEVATRGRDVSAKLREIVRRERGATGSKIVLSASVVRLARRLGKSTEAVAEGIPNDTLRRMKAPVFEQENEDGTITFKQPPVIISDGRRGLDPNKPLS